MLRSLACSALLLQRCCLTDSAAVDAPELMACNCMNAWLSWESVCVCIRIADENKVLAGKAGAIDAVVAAMRAHVGSAGVSEQACRALCRICKNGRLCFVLNVNAKELPRPVQVVGVVDPNV